MNEKVNYTEYPIYSFLIGETMLADSLSMSTPINSNIINIISCLQALIDINFIYPLIIDPSSLCLNYLKEFFN